LLDKGDKPKLAAICTSISRLLTKGIVVLNNDKGQEEKQLSKVNTKLLNTFKRAEMLQDLIKLL